jgi:hypothetical protein
MKARFLQIADDFRGVSADLRTTLCRKFKRDSLTVLRGLAPGQRRARS